MIKSHCFVFCCSCYLYKTRTFGPCDVHASNTWNLRWTLKKNRVLDELQWNKTVFAFPKVCFTLLHNGDEASFDLFSLFRGCWGCNTDQHWPAQCVASECLQKTAWMRLSSTNHSLLACRTRMMNMMNQQKICCFPLHPQELLWRRTSIYEARLLLPLSQNLQSRNKGNVGSSWKMRSHFGCHENWQPCFPLVQSNWWGQWGHQTVN